MSYGDIYMHHANTMLKKYNIKYVPEACNITATPSTGDEWYFNIELKSNHGIYLTIFTHEGTSYFKSFTIATKTKYYSGVNRDDLKVALRDWNLEVDRVMNIGKLIEKI